MAKESRFGLALVVAVVVLTALAGWNDLRPRGEAPPPTLVAELTR